MSFRGSHTVALIICFVAMAGTSSKTYSFTFQVQVGDASQRSSQVVVPATDFRARLPTVDPDKRWLVNAESMAAYNIAVGANGPTNPFLELSLEDPASEQIIVQPTETEPERGLFLGTVKDSDLKNRGLAMYLVNTGSATMTFDLNFVLVVYG